MLTFVRGGLAGAIVLVLFASGCAHRGTTSAPASSAAPTPDLPSLGDREVAPARTRADREHGKELFASVQCAQCHGVGGAGGVGPNLHGERLKKHGAALIAWIKSPQPPMPKLYPSALDDADVRDVAAYVESL